MVNRGAKSDSIPMDLIPEILSRLPAKSIARFRCVSKPWKSIICRQDFTKLFHTISSSNPRLLIVVKQGDECSVFSSPQPQNHYGKSSLVVAADIHTKFSKDLTPWCFSYASGLLYITKKYDFHVVGMICNPTTGQYEILPPDDVRKLYGHPSSVLVFDPIGKQYKVLVFNRIVDDGLVYRIQTLGTENVRWREIKCPSFHGPDHNNGICINGVLYFKTLNNKIGYFDVRSEKFKLLDVDPGVIRCFCYLINYKGKFCGSELEYGHDGGFPIKLHMWVLEDVEKREWSKYAYTLSAKNKVVKVNKNLSVVGMTALGEIVLAMHNSSKPFYVFYFNPQRNTLLSVEIQGVQKKWFHHHEIFCFVDHVEDLNFDVTKTTYAATSIRPPEHSTSTSSREDHQERIVHLEQDLNTFAF